MSTTRSVWERQPAETPPAFAAFEVYLRQGTGRSVTKVAIQCNKSRSLMNRWSSRHRWTPRAEAWDAHLSSAYRAEVVDAQRSLAHRHLAVAHAALEKVTAAVQAVDCTDLSVPELVRLWDIAARTEREALAVPLRVEVSGPEGAPIVVAALTDEERHARLAALRREIDKRIGDRLDDDHDQDDQCTANPHRKVHRCLLAAPAGRPPAPTRSPVRRTNGSPL